MSPRACAPCMWMQKLLRKIIIKMSGMKRERKEEDEKGERRRKRKHEPTANQTLCSTHIVEDYPQGYPRFSALISSHPSFSLCRRFSNLRARLLLRKQDRLALLERRLERLDAEEENRLALGSIRRDDNEERLALLAEIDEALLDYGKIPALPSPSPFFCLFFF